MSRRYPETPLVGVSGVVVAGDKVLLVKRGRPPAMGLWSVPGGRLKLGEELKAGCAREIWEETGIRAEVGPLVEVLDRISTDSEGRVEYHYVLVDFACRAEETPPVPGDDAGDAAWVPVGELGDRRLTPDTLWVIEKAYDLINTG